MLVVELSEGLEALRLNNASLREDLLLLTQLILHNTVHQHYVLHTVQDTHGPYLAPPPRLTHGTVVYTDHILFATYCIPVNNSTLNQDCRLLLFKYAKIFSLSQEPIYNKELL